jgi:biopolymer transport protein ExbD
MKIHKKTGDDIEINMSPMIDLVFLLLIFFLVASQIIKVEKVKIEVPTAEYANIPPDETGRFAITVDPDGKLYVGTAPVTIDQLKVRLQAELEANSEVLIVLRADQKVRYKVNQEIMQACADVGAVNMIFAAYTP